MSKETVTKVMKYELRYLEGCGDFQGMQENVWALQRKTREILNRTIQICYHWDYLNLEHYKETGEYLDLQKEKGYKRLDGYIYDCLKNDCSDMASVNINATIQKAWSKYTSAKSELLRGNMSVPSYKKDQPLLIHKQGIKFSIKENRSEVEMALFSKQFNQRTGFPTRVKFAVQINDGTQRSIFDRVVNRKYGYGQCQLVYDRPKWFLLLTYSFIPEKYTLDENRILGVDLGEVNAIYASVYDEYGSLKIEGGEVTEFAKKWEARRHSLQKQAAFCGDGRIGHGTKTRVSNVYQAKEHIANFRDTINHRYSKALIDFAIKKKCGIIQMEDLTGIKEDAEFPKFLRHWTYYDLQQKIEAKAKEHGIKVEKVNPQFTSKRCSKCGNIDKDNRKTQADFRCTQCGFSANADFNASQNLAVKDIDKLIQKTISAKEKRTEKQ